MPMIQAARQNLGVAAQSTTTLADTAYGADADLQAAAAQGLALLVSPAEGKPAHANLRQESNLCHTASQSRSD